MTEEGNNPYSTRDKKRSNSLQSRENHLICEPNLCKSKEKTIVNGCHSADIRTVLSC